MSIPSENLQLLMAGYVLGDLSPEEAVAFEEVLANDPAIAAAVVELQQALETTYNPPVVKPGEHVRSAILEHAAATRTEANRTPAKQRKLLPWRGLSEAVAAVLIITLGVRNYQLSQQVDQARSPQDGTLTYVLDATKPDSQATATIVVNPNTLEATITVQNLPPLPPGKVYALWTVVQPNAPFTTDAKQAILTDVFQVDDHGSVSQAIAVPKAFRSQKLVRKVAVTIEDATAPQNHTGSPVMITGL